MDNVTVKPKEGLIVRDEQGIVLPAAGANKPLNSYWRRRLKEDAVEIVTPTGPASSGKASKTAKPAEKSAGTATTESKE
ncbi:MAG: DUF2635 domain-containing protein [Rhodospirillales bacterium]